MNINKTALKDLAYSSFDSIKTLKTLDLLDTTHKLLRVSYNYNSTIEVCMGRKVSKADCAAANFRCTCRTITIDSEFFYDVRCVTVYVNFNNGDMDNIITITTSEAVKNLSKDDIRKIVDKLKSIESADENTMLDRFSVEYKQNIIILEDQKRSLIYRPDHIVQTILDL